MARLTDDRAVLLLGLLADYFADDAAVVGGSVDPTTLTVSELAGDLIDSLPRLTQLPVDVGLTRPDALTYPRR